MGKKDITLKDYLSERRRYADLINGSVFQGEQIVRADDLTEANAVQTKVYNGQRIERINDLVMREGKDGKLFAVWVVANQEHVDYSMPVRVMLQEALEYDRQLKEIRCKNHSAYQMNAGEYLSGICRSDRLRPVVTVVVYWGSGKWQGAENLHDMIDFGQDADLAEKIRDLVPVYRLHVLNLSEQEDSQLFRTELRTLFELYARRNSREAFRTYLNTHKECQKMDEETCKALSLLTGSAKLSDMIFKRKEKEEINVGGVIEELIEDGREEGRKEGIRAMAAAMKKLNIPIQKICEAIAEQFGMSEEQAQKYI